MIAAYIFWRMLVWTMIIIVTMTALFIYILAFAVLGFLWVLGSCWALISHHQPPQRPKPGGWVPRNARMYYSSRR